MVGWKSYVWLGCTLLGGWLSFAPLAAQEADAPDVYREVQRVRGELELIRFLMGRPQNEQAEIQVQNAAARDAFYQALTMFRKAERLCFEQTRQHFEQPEIPSSNIQLADVRRVVQATLQCLDRVKDQLGIIETVNPPAADSGKTTTDILQSTVQANRQLNLLLEHQFAPSDVFQQVTLGMGYTSRLLASFPDLEQIPEEPEFEPGKRPRDVYRRLLDCFDRIRRIAVMSRLPMLEIEARQSLIANAAPSDVYDIASLLVADLAFLHSRLDSATPPRTVYYVGRKFPSHVFQRAGILERQLELLEQGVKDNPNWLSPTDSDE